MALDLPGAISIFLTATARCESCGCAVDQRRRGSDECGGRDRGASEVEDVKLRQMKKD